MTQRLLLILVAGALIADCTCSKGGKGGNNGGNGGGLQQIDGDPVGNPNPLDFGTVGTGTTHSKSFTFTNTGDGPLNILSSALTGDTAFTAASQTGVSLQPGDKITVNVTFTPPTDGPHAAKLTFTTDSISTPTYVENLTGIAFSYKVEVAPVELDFGEVQVGTSSPPQTLTVTNNSSAAETISVGPIGAGPGSGDFQVNPTGNQASVASGATFTVTVVYAPSVTGAEQATLPISACNGCTPVNVALTGTGIDTQIVVDDDDTFQPSVSFGPVPQGQTVTANVIAQATGLPPTATTLLTATLTAPPTLENGASPGFTVTPTDSNWNPAPWPASLTPGPPGTSIAYFTVSYTAPSNANANAVVDVAYTVGALTTVRIAKLPVSAGTASGQCSQVVASPTSVTFGTVAANSSVSKVVTLTNNGLELCQLSNVGINPNDQFNEFALQGGTVPLVSLAAGQSQPFTVTFTPQSGTPPLLRKADLSMTTNDTTTPSITVPLSGSLQNTVYANSAWPKWHHDNANTGLSQADTSGNVGTLIWKVGIGAPTGPSGLYASYLHSPVIGKDPNSGDDIVYMLGYNNWSAPPKWGQPGSGFGLLYAVDGPSGNTVWSTPMTGPEASAQESTPTIVADNSIFVMTGGEQGTYPQFFHIAPNGSILWSGVQAIGGAVFECPFTATPSATANCSTASTNPQVNDGFDTCPGLDDNGLLYLYDDDQPGCDTYNPTTGVGGAPNPVWSATASQPVSSSGKPAAHMESFSAALTDTGQSVFSWGGYVLAFNPSATTAPAESWTMTTGNGQMQVGWATVSKGGCETTSKGSPAIDGTDAVVAFGGFTVNCQQAMGGIVAINLQSGVQDWGFQFPNAALPPAPFTYTAYNESEIVLADSSPATVGNGDLVMGWLDGVYDFTPPANPPGNATQTWYVKTGLVLSSPAVGADGTVFVGSTDGNLYAINGMTGQVKFTYNVGAAINSSPAIGSDGTIYFAADDGNLYAVR